MECCHSRCIRNVHAGSRAQQELRHILMPRFEGAVQWGLSPLPLLVDVCVAAHEQLCVWEEALATRDAEGRVPVVPLRVVHVCFVLDQQLSHVQAVETYSLMKGCSCINIDENMHAS